MDGLIEEHLGMPARQFSKTFYGQCWKDLSTIFGDYCITEIGKLHNLYVEGNNRNLSIDYVVSRDFWSDEEKDKINDLVSSMKVFFEKIEPAHDNLLTRNDFNTYLDETITVLGEFETGEDQKYFQELAELCNLVWGKLVERNLGSVDIYRAAMTPATR